MIRKTEIRIGNFLLPSKFSTHYLSVAGINFSGIHFTGDGEVYSFEQIEPVPLSEELLRGFNFLYGRKYLGDDFFDIKYCPDFFGAAHWEFRYNKHMLTTIKYLHEVQNLIFFISGKDLSV